MLPIIKLIAVIVALDAAILTIVITECSLFTGFFDNDSASTGFFIAAGTFCFLFDAAIVILNLSNHRVARSYWKLLIEYITVTNHIRDNTEELIKQFCDRVRLSGVASIEEFSKRRVAEERTRLVFMHEIALLLNQDKFVQYVDRSLEQYLNKSLLGGLSIEDVREYVLFNRLPADSAV